MVALPRALPQSCQADVSFDWRIGLEIIELRLFRMGSEAVAHQLPRQQFNNLTNVIMITEVRTILLYRQGITRNE